MPTSDEIEAKARELDPFAFSKEAERTYCGDDRGTLLQLQIAAREKAKSALTEDRFSRATRLAGA